MRWFSKSDNAAYQGLDAGAESETRIAHMLANATGKRSGGSILQSAKDLGWVDPGEPIPGLGLMPSVSSSNPVDWRIIIMSGGIAQTHELVQIILATRMAQQGLIAFDRAAGIIRIYADGVWHGLQTPDCPDHEGACLALEMLRQEAFVIARELGLVEDEWARRWFVRVYDQDLIRNGVTDDSEVEPGSGVTVGTVKALAMRLGKGAAMTKAGSAQRAELRRKRMDSMSADGFRKAWKELPNQPELRKATFGKGQVNGRSAVIVARNAVLRDDGTLGVFNPSYFATDQTSYDFFVPDDPTVFTAMASAAGWTPPKPIPVSFMGVLKHLTCGDKDVMAHIVGLVGAQLLGKDTGQKALAFIGAPASGKSLFLKAVQQAVGTAARAIGKNILSGSQRDDTRVASLCKAKPRFLVCAEFQDFSGRADWGLFKEIVGGDTINGRLAYDRAGTDGRFDTLLVLASNGLPPMASDVMAVIRRLDVVFVPAHRQLKGPAMNSGLEAAIVAEAPEIARLLVQFGARFQADRDRPEAMKRALDMVDSSWGPKVRQWLTENTTPAPKGHAPMSALKLNFDKWCAEALGIAAEIKPDEFATQILDQGGGLYVKGRKRAPGAPPSSNAIASIIGLQLTAGGFNSGVPAASANTCTVVPFQSPVVTAVP